MRISGSRGALYGATAIVVTILVVALGVLGRGDPPRAGTTPARPRVAVRPVVPRPAVDALGVLRRWDRARSRAWAAGDVAALGRLYVPGSRAGMRDQSILRAWLRRGLRVRGMVMQVLAVETRAHDGRRIVLLVTDRLARGVVRRAAAAGGGFPLPRDGPTTRRLVFRRVGPGGPGGPAGRWLLASAQPRASPVASTAATSGSSNS